MIAVYAIDSWGECERRGLVRNDPIGGLPRLGCQTVPQGPGYPCELAFVIPPSHPPVSSKFLFPEGSGAGISTPSASADPLLAGAGTAASAVVGCSRERARAASSALADIAAGSRCYPRDVFAAARPLLLARKEERCVGARSRSTSVHSNNSLCSEIGRLANPPS